MARFVLVNFSTLGFVSVFLIRGHVHMMSPVGGGGGYPKSRCSKGGWVNLVLRIDPKCRQGGEGVKNPGNFADVMCTCPLKQTANIRTP